MQTNIGKKDGQPDSPASGSGAIAASLRAGTGAVEKVSRFLLCKGAGPHRIKEKESAIRGAKILRACLTAKPGRCVPDLIVANIGRKQRHAGR